MTDRYATLRHGLIGAWCPSLGAGPVIASRGNVAARGVVSFPSFIASGSGVAANVAGGSGLDSTSGQSVLSVDAPHMASLLGDSGSMTVWIRLNLATPVAGSLTGFAHTENISGFSASVYPWVDGKAYISVFRQTTRVDNITLSTAVDRTKWHLVSIVVGGGRWQMYQNDIMVADVAYASGVGFTPSAFRVGRSINFSTTEYYWLNGQWDDVRIYNRALTRSEIKLLASQRGIGLLPTRHRRANVLGSSMHLNAAGTWKRSTPWINVNGVWKQATPKINVGGVWK